MCNLNSTQRSTGMKNVLSKIITKLFPTKIEPLSDKRYAYIVQNIENPELSEKTRQLLNNVDKCTQPNLLEWNANSCYFDSMLFSILFHPTKYIWANIIVKKVGGNVQFKGKDCNLQYIQRELRKLMIHFHSKYIPSSCNISHLRDLFEIYCKKGVAEVKEGKEGDPNDAYRFLMDLFNAPKPLIENTWNYEGSHIDLQSIPEENKTQENVREINVPSTSSDTPIRSIINKAGNWGSNLVNTKRDLIFFSLNRDVNNPIIFTNLNPTKDILKLEDIIKIPTGDLQSEEVSSFKLSRIIIYKASHYYIYFKCGDVWFMYNDYPSAHIKKIGEYSDLIKLDDVLTMKKALMYIPIEEPYYGIDPLVSQPLQQHTVSMDTDTTSVETTKVTKETIDVRTERTLPSFKPLSTDPIVFETLPDGPKLRPIPKIPEGINGWTESCEVDYIDLGPRASQVQKMSEQEEADESKKIEDEADIKGESFTLFEKIVNFVNKSLDRPNKIEVKKLPIPSNLETGSSCMDRLKYLFKELWSNVKNKDSGAIQQSISDIRACFTTNTPPLPGTPSLWNEIGNQIPITYGKLLTSMNAKKQALKFTGIQKRETTQSSTYKIRDYGLISAMGGTRTSETGQVGVQTGISPRATNQILEIVEPLPCNIAFKHGVASGKPSRTSSQFTKVYTFLDNTPVATVVMVLSGGNTLEGLYLKIGRKLNDNRWVKLNKLRGEQPDSSIQNQIWYRKIGKFIIPLLDIIVD